MPFYVHSLEGQPREKWETMAEHEDHVAKLCANFLKRIDANLEAWGDLLGRWHDLGKYSNEFQTYLHQSNDLLNELPDVHRAEVCGRIDHSTAAAQLSLDSFEAKGKLLAYAFAGHHAGLPDWDDGTTQTGLRQRLKKKIPQWTTNAPRELIASPFPGMPKFQKPDDSQIAAFRISFFVRMIFSALVDADFLATESFMSPDRVEHRPKNKATLSNILATLEIEISNLQTSAKATPLNLIRRNVSDQCLTKAQLPPGFFSLSVRNGRRKNACITSICFEPCGCSQLGTGRFRRTVHKYY